MDYQIIGNKMKLIMVMFAVLLLMSCNEIDNTFDDMSKISIDIGSILSEECKAKAMVSYSGTTNKINEIGVEFIGRSKPICDNDIIEKAIKKYMNGKFGYTDFKLKIFPFKQT